ncbi:hypothetical protein DM860_011267 [Cuscuta australis]|uniref:DUF223 domain-containing protein n=1 Tax=Cuscuta australis TaxID=267555 RepID=A0A328DT11_9ASTE|nr:hypothetical protein DM860_011267 [Cuscuta australis]
MSWLVLGYLSGLIRDWAAASGPNKSPLHRASSCNVIALHLARVQRFMLISKKPEKKKFEEQIVEGGVFAIRNVFVYDNYQSCKTNSHKSLLVFYQKTEVKTLSELDFPKIQFDLKSFSSIEAHPYLNDQLLIDVIGKIVGRSKVQTHIKRGEEEKLMEITLEDHEGNRMACTLWGEYVEKFLNCLTQDVPGPFILLPSFCRVRRYRGVVTVSTAFHVTKMIFDGNSDEVNHFRASVRLRSSENTPDWCYLGCTECNKKVIPDHSQF